VGSYQQPCFASENGAEQRLFLRKKVTLPLPIELMPGKEVWLDDLGEGGLSVSGSSRLELGTNTFLTFQFPEANSTIEAAGVVAWCGISGRAGVRFTRIKPDSTAALKRWLKADTDSVSKTSVPAEHSSEFALRLWRDHYRIADLKTEIASKGLHGDAALDRIAQRMLRLTRAHGAAIALRQGDEVICRATAGNAPTIGVKLNIERSLTGACYRTGNIVALADSGNDSRVDAELCRQMEFRALLVVPIVSMRQVVGVAAVFSAIPGNFEGGDVLLLDSAAELIAQIYAPAAPLWRAANP